MKKSLFVCILLLAPMNSANADVQFRMVPLGEYVKSAGSFVLETGKKACEGIQTTAFGLGEIITSPFRADVYKPKKKTYWFVKPELNYREGRFYRKD